jgi:F0F1-type ATP synthase membrane subunit b/b'
MMSQEEYENRKRRLTANLEDANKTLARADLLVRQVKRELQELNAARKGETDE